MLRSLYLVGCLIASQATAQTAFDGHRLPTGTVITGAASGTWSLEDSPFFLTGDVRVSDLVIEAGVEVYAGPTATLIVEGSLAAQGEPDSQVRFSSLSIAQRWRGIRFANASGSSSLQHTLIERSERSGLRIVDSQVALSHCTISDNNAPWSGGGLRATLTTNDLTLNDCVIRNNDAIGYGGGMSVTLGSGVLSLDGCHVNNNSATARLAFNLLSGGGGLYAVGGSVDLTDCRFSGNSLTSLQNGFGTGIAEGGGLSVRNADLTMTRCIVSNNMAHGLAGIARVFGNADGAGLHYKAPGFSAQIDNTIFAGNFAHSDASDFENAAGISVVGGAMTLTNSVISRNRSRIGTVWSARWGQGSSGLRVASGSALLQNTIVYANTMSGFYSLWFPPAQHQVVGNGITVRYSNVEGGYAGIGNFDMAPHFVGTGSGYYDFGLTALSPCVDAGDPAAAFEDAFFPPSLGTLRNDLGVNGGPLADGWLNW